MTLTLRTTRPLWGARSIIHQTARHLPVALLMLTVLSLTQVAAFAGTITSFGPDTPVGCTNLPSPSTSGNAFAVDLTADCILRYNYVGGAANLYPMTFTITNDTGFDMTDLHIDLISANSFTPFFSGAALISGPLVLVKQTALTLDFNWVTSTLHVGGLETISVNLTLPLGNASGFDSIEFDPTFGSASASPEPASLTLGLSGAVLMGLGEWRRRRRSLRQGQTIPPPC